MSVWSMITLQNSNSPSMEFITYFNDLTMILIIMLMTLFCSMMVSLKMVNSFSILFPESQSMEDLWLMVPIIFLMFLGFPSIKNLYMCEEFNEMDLNLKVKGHQWYWSYEFLNFSFDSIMDKESTKFRLIETFNHLIIPIKCMIRLLITSNDVIHSWTIPSMGIKMDAIPGRISQSVFLVNRPSMLTGQCSEICGTNHSFMPIVISANSMNSFIYKK